MENLQGFAETLLRSYIALATSEINNFFIWMFLRSEPSYKEVKFWGLIQCCKGSENPCIQEVAKILMYGLNFVNRCVCLRGALSFGIWYNPYRLYALTWIWAMHTFHDFVAAIMWFQLINPRGSYKNRSEMSVNMFAEFHFLHCPCQEQLKYIKRSRCCDKSALIKLWS